MNRFSRFRGKHRSTNRIGLWTRSRVVVYVLVASWHPQLATADRGKFVCSICFAITLEPWIKELRTWLAASCWCGGIISSHSLWRRCTKMFPRYCKETENLLSSDTTEILESQKYFARSSQIVPRTQKVVTVSPISVLTPSRIPCKWQPSKVQTSTNRSQGLSQCLEESNIPTKSLKVQTPQKSTY